MDRRIKNLWSKQQDRFLKDHFMTMSRKEMAEKLGKNFHSVQRRMDKHLKLNRDVSLRTAMIGKKFGLLTAISYVGRKNNRSFYDCICKCGKHKTVEYNTLILNKIRSCGCHRSKYLERTQYNVKFYSYKRAAKKRNLPFQLNFKQFKLLISQNCHYCGSNPSPMPLLSVYKKRNVPLNRAITINSVDRIDNNIGYILKNCVSCCILCNDMKHALPVSTFLSHANKITKYQEQQ